MAYASEQDEAKARKLGYAVRKSQKTGSSFQNGDRFIWSTRVGWQTADRNNGSYINHEIFNKLSDALERDL